MKDDMDKIRFYRFNTYEFIDSNMEITEWDHGPCYNPVEVWKDVHGYESSRDINCGIARNFSQLGWGIKGFIIERIVCFILVLAFYYAVWLSEYSTAIKTGIDPSENHVLSPIVIIGYGVVLLIRISQLVKYFILKRRMNKIDDNIDGKDITITTIVN